MTSHTIVYVFTVFLVIHKGVPISAKTAKASFDIGALLFTTSECNCLCGAIYILSGAFVDICACYLIGVQLVSLGARADVTTNSIYTLLLTTMKSTTLINIRTRSFVSVQNETIFAYTTMTSYQILTGTIIYVTEAIAVSAFINILTLSIHVAKTSSA